MAPQGKLILVTGANGFVGTHAVQSLLENGYRVRAVVRSQNSAENVWKINYEAADRLSIATVPDLTKPGALDSVVEDIDGALHIASPFTFTVTDNETELLRPAIELTENVLASIAAHAPKAKRVVITSSFAAIGDFTKGKRPGHVYTEADWNNLTYEYGKTADPVIAYTISKTLAEKAAWKFVADKKPAFDLTVLCPPMVFGPPAHPISFAAPNVSAWDMDRFISGEMEEVPETTIWSFVDVRDLAMAHVRALEVPEAGNERFFIVGGRYSYQQTADVLRTSFRLLEKQRSKVPVGFPGRNYPGSDVYEVDGSKSKKILGMEYRSFEESIVDAAVKLIEAKEKGPVSAR